MENFDLLIENSINSQDQSNLTKLFETNSTENISNYRTLVTKIIKRLKTDSDLEAFCSVIPTNSPSGVIPVYGEKLTGKNTNNVSVFDTLRIFKFDSAISDNVGDIISNGTATAELLYKEDIYCLVKITSGTFQATDTISSQTLIEIYSAIHSMGVLLENYSGEYTTAQGEELSESEEIDFELIMSQVDVTTKDIRTGVTRETLTDLLKIWGVTKINSIETSLSSCLADKTRQRIFTFMRNNAVERPLLTLTDSYGTGSGITQVYAEIYSRINQSVGAIGTNTGISAGKYTVIASSDIVAGLKTLLKRDILEKNNISYLPGDITLIEDGYAKNDYLLVALRGPNNNSAVIHTPYDIIINSAIDSKDFSEKIVIKARNTTVNNPLMDLNESVKNPMMELTYVDTTNVLNMF